MRSRDGVPVSASGPCVPLITVTCLAAAALTTTSASRATSVRNRSLFMGHSQKPAHEQGMFDPKGFGKECLAAASSSGRRSRSGCAQLDDSLVARIAVVGTERVGELALELAAR